MTSLISENGRWFDDSSMVVRIALPAGADPLPADTRCRQQLLARSGQTTRPRLHKRHHRGGLRAKRTCELDERRQGRLTLAPFEHADVVAFEFGFEPQLLLRQPGPFAQITQNPPEGDRNFQGVLQLWLEKFGRATRLLSANHSGNSVLRISRRIPVHAAFRSMATTGSTGQSACEPSSGEAQ